MKGSSGGVETTAANAPDDRVDGVNGPTISDANSVAANHAKIAESASSEAPSPAKTEPPKPDGIDAELRALVADLRAIIADLRADNARLREQLGERVAPVVDLASKRGR